MLIETIPHVAPPQWSPYALLVGAIVGFLFGAITAALYALRLQRLERLAGSGRLRPTR